MYLAQCVPGTVCTLHNVYLEQCVPGSPVQNCGAEPPPVQQPSSCPSPTAIQATLGLLHLQSLLLPDPYCCPSWPGPLLQQLHYSTSSTYFCQLAAVLVLVTTAMAFWHYLFTISLKFSFFGGSGLKIVTRTNYFASLYLDFRMSMSIESQILE